MNEMIERVAKAIAQEHYGRKKNACAYGPEARRDWLVNRYWDHFTADATAVIKAMREPSEAMAKAGAHAELNESGYDMSYVVYLAEEGATECWQSMIDAALQEPE